MSNSCGCVIVVIWIRAIRFVLCLCLIIRKQIFAIERREIPRQHAVWTATATSCAETFGCRSLSHISSEAHAMVVNLYLLNSTQDHVCMYAGLATRAIPELFKLLPWYSALAVAEWGVCWHFVHHPDVQESEKLDVVSKSKCKQSEFRHSAVAHHSQDVKSDGAVLLLWSEWVCSALRLVNAPIHSAPWFPLSVTVNVNTLRALIHRSPCCDSYRFGGSFVLLWF